MVPRRGRRRRAIVTNIEGGRSGGYRTATSKLSPAPGHWRAELFNQADQLVGRVAFDVLQ